MATRKTHRPVSPEAAAASSESLKALEQQVIAIAEQLGRIAGAAHGKADSWLEQPALRSQLARIRDRAAALVRRFHAQTPAEGDGLEKKAAARARSRAKVAAPGKKHRRAPESPRGVKHSDEKVPKALAAARRKTARPRQG